MRINEYQHLAMRTSNDEHDRILNGVLGLNGEAGEVIDIYKKHKMQEHEFDTAKMIDELGDVLWYCAELATGLGVTLENVAEHNVEKLMKRYPEGFSAERSIHREG